FHITIHDGGAPPPAPTTCMVDDACATTEYCQVTIGQCCQVGYKCDGCVAGDTITQGGCNAGAADGGGCPAGFGCVGVAGTGMTVCECSASKTAQTRLCGGGAWRCLLTDLCGPSVEQACCPVRPVADVMPFRFEKTA